MEPTAITFRVDDVEPAREAPSTVPLREQLAGALAFGGDGDARVLLGVGVHPLLAAVHAAFAEHRPLVLSPDVVWLTIAQGVAQHVRQNAEALRGLLVRHAGKKTLDVEWPGAFPEDAASLAAIVGRFRAALGDAIGHGRARLLTCDFSTSTDVERMASEIVLLDAFSPYFDYSLACVCGIPEITLLGTVDDWRRIRERVDVLAELDLAFWTPSLARIADAFVDAASGRPDVAFFRAIYKPRAAYGGDRVTGWIARLYPYVGEGGRFTAKNPLLDHPIDAPFPEPDPGVNPLFASTLGIRTDDVPAGGGSCLVRVRDVDGARFDLVLEGGVLAVEVDAAGRLAPRAAWTARRSSASIAAVLAAMEARDDVELTRPPPDAKTIAGGPAEIVALFDHVHDARLFVRGATWRLRPRAEHDRVEVPTGGRRPASVVRVVDLPDGSTLGYEPHGAIWVRLDGAPRAANEVQVVGRSLAEILTAALASDGRAPLASLGTLWDALPAWQRR